MEATFNVGSYAIGRETMVLSDLYASLKKTYCGSIGADYMHLTSTEEKRWLQDRLESIEGKGNYTLEEKTRFLESLTAAEGLEKYLGAKFPGAKRFSLEGAMPWCPCSKSLFAAPVSRVARKPSSVWPTAVASTCSSTYWASALRTCSTSSPASTANPGAQGT
jgi:2-oxoglutarate dehydrogenase complex dehydrogenase (E1) component-like enzyme